MMMRMMMMMMISRPKEEVSATRAPAKHYSPPPSSTGPGLHSFFLLNKKREAAQQATPSKAMQKEERPKRKEGKRSALRNGRRMTSRLLPLTVSVLCVLRLSWAACSLLWTGVEHFDWKRTGATFNPFKSSLVFRLTAGINARRRFMECTERDLRGRMRREFLPGGGEKGGRRRARVPVSSHSNVCKETKASKLKEHTMSTVCHFSIRYDHHAASLKPGNFAFLAKLATYCQGRDRDHFQTDTSSHTKISGELRTD
ncbi:hypothetical protein SELMODRAFT_410130 [Selaginella moellendorffii]|uniref:Uncharacterized protein n=1 Tax=Selaginella moellendorffii TaxID=88036 RepID=D8RDR0_SELML|nr:hypothetical protein SELMODRAFT_410130 [Selaginella moellendorffii]